MPQILQSLFVLNLSQLRPARGVYVSQTDQSGHDLMLQIVQCDPNSFVPVVSLKIDIFVNQTALFQSN